MAIKNEKKKAIYQPGEKKRPHGHVPDFTEANDPNILPSSV